MGWEWCCTATSNGRAETASSRVTESGDSPSAGTELVVLSPGRVGGTLLTMYQSHSTDSHSTQSTERRLTRRVFNLAELDAVQQFVRWDLDGSGFLEHAEVEEMLRVIAGRSPSEEEIAWLMKVADKDGNGKISRQELLVALQAWHGYINLPPEMGKLFAEFDKNEDEHLDFQELKSLLTRVNERSVSDLETQQVMEVADLLSDGKIGKYEFLGALGAWYVAVGRQPTPAMALAFLANNRTGSRLHLIVHWLMAITLFVSAYFPMSAAVRNNHCKMDIHSVLWADALLWVVFTVVVLMKGHWVELANALLGTQHAYKWLFAMSWATMLFEVACLMSLAIVEGIGFFYVQQEEHAGEAEVAACEEDATLPLDVPLSIKARHLRRYPSYIEFCQIWFTFNFALNFVTILVYYVFLAWRFHKTRQADNMLQAESEQATEVERAEKC
mmetsp:Transcript_40133/g.92212  ORF Transcript_40133/g.92212 Transcript_40133/m.92212 type:complete len:443 (+) Transcript_40133:70-1398(+)